MFNIPTGQIILGSARVIVQDRGELTPRISECNCVAAGSAARRAFRAMAGRLVRKFGVLGLVGLAAMMNGQSPDSGQHLPLVLGTITSAIATSWKRELGLGTHDFSVANGDVVKTALYTSNADLNASTRAYSATDEVSGAGYTTGGATMANVAPITSGSTAIFDWADVSWTDATFTANGCLAYNASKADKAIFVVGFAGDQSVTAGTFTIQWPAPDASNAIIRID